MRFVEMKIVAWPAFKTRYQNPYTWLLYSHLPPSVEVAEFSAQRLLFEPFDVFHLHWPVETLVRHPNIWVARLRVLVFWLVLKLAKWRGLKVVWTIHDEKPHVVLHPRLAAWFQARLVANTDSYIHLCAASKTAVARTLPELARKPSAMISHGHYRDYYPNAIDRQAARSLLNISPDTKALLYLGYISPYKNVPHLIRAFRQLAATGKTGLVTLLVAGKPDDRALEEAVRTAAEGSADIQLHLRFIRDEELQIFFNAADLVVLPFEEILNSGSLLLALSFNRPVLAPDLGAVSDWQGKVGSNWVRTYRGVLTAAMLQAAMQHPAPAGAAPIDFLSWDAIARQTLESYRRTAGMPTALSLSPRLTYPASQLD